MQPGANPSTISAREDVGTGPRQACVQPLGLAKNPPEAMPAGDRSGKRVETAWSDQKDARTTGRNA
jgi:hypothetical protein